MQQLQSTRQRLARVSTFTLLGLLAFAITGPTVAKPLSTLIKDVQQQLVDIDDGKRTISQRIQQSKTKPYELMVERKTITNSSGKQAIETWRFSLADIDAKLLQYQADGNAIELNLLSSNKEKVVRYFKGDGTTKYVADIELVLSNMDRMRVAKAKLAAAIPQAEKVWSNAIRPITQSDNARRKWLAARQYEEDINGKLVKQAITIDSRHLDKLSIKTVTTNQIGKTNEAELKLSIADILPQSLIMKVGKDVKIEGRIKREEKLVQVYKDGAISNYQNKFTIIADTPDEAKLIKQVISELVKPSEKILHARLPAVTNPSLISSTFAKQVGEITLNKKHLAQTITPTCEASYTLKDTHKLSGKVSEKQMHFDYSWLEPNSIKVQAKKDVLVMNVNIKNKEKYVSVSKDGKPASFVSSLSIMLANVDQARYARRLLPFVIKNCHRPIKPLGHKAFSGLLGKQFTQSKAYNVAFKSTGKCTAEFNIEEQKKTKAKSTSYEFNFTDLNDRAVALKVSGKRVNVNIGTLYNEKVIKVYDGKKSKFENRLSIPLANVKDALVAQKTIASLIGQCQ